MQSVSDTDIQTADVAKKQWNIADFQIPAHSAISLATNLVDENDNQILFSKNEQAKLPIASLTKLMTAIVALDTYELSDNIVVDALADSVESVSKDLKLGDTLSMDDLLHIMLISSSNKAAMALAEKVGETNFVWLMNEKAKYIGLENTHYADATGLSQDNYSTSGDLARLAIYILKNYPQIVQITEKKEIELPSFGKVESTNQLLGKIRGIIIGKTGFTLDAKGCLLLAIYNQKAKNYLINVILASDDRFKDMQKMINWVDDAYSWQKS